jgi:branched-chain amino acid transport system ATP-binding protein
VSAATDPASRASQPDTPVARGGGPDSGDVILDVRDIRVYYGAIEALKGVSLSITRGDIVTLIGANGAGKTTTLNAISSLQRPRSGAIVYEGRDITSVQPYDIVKLGISQSPEGRKIFPRMTVKENLEMGAFSRPRQDLKSDFDRVWELFPLLRERTNQPGGTLSGGEQQMLAMGRALMAEPKLMMLDEPSMGLAPMFVERIFSIIQEINDQGTTILLVEQNANVALEISHRGYVLETGRVVLADTAENLLADPHVQDAYLGGGDADEEAAAEPLAE